jgi:hypothetical protein
MKISWFHKVCFFQIQLVLLRIGCPWDWRLCAYAARHGRTEVVQWAQANGIPLYEVGLHTLKSS